MDARPVACAPSRPPVMLGFVVATVLALAASAAAQPKPESSSEVLLQPVPKGFKIASQQAAGGYLVQEMIPETETLDDWSTIIVTSIFQGKADWPPEQELVAEYREIQKACPSAGIGEIMTSEHNGYETAVAIVQCHESPRTKALEVIYMRGMRGLESFYTVKVNMRGGVPDPKDGFNPADYLTSIKLCDDERPGHPCPALGPEVGATAEPLLSPMARFLYAADADDGPRMRALLRPEDLKIMDSIKGCYLRKVLQNDESREIVALWMCPEGPKRSRVVIATVGQTDDGRLMVTQRGDISSDRPAPPRTGAAFAKTPSR